jgi:hypothetical protein
MSGDIYHWLCHIFKHINFLPDKNKPQKTLQRFKKKLFPAECTLLCVAGVGMAVVLDHPEEALLLVGVLGDAVEEEGADTDSSLRHVINHLKSTMEIVPSSTGSLLPGLY